MSGEKLVDVRKARLAREQHRGRLLTLWDSMSEQAQWQRRWVRRLAGLLRSRDKRPQFRHDRMLLPWPHAHFHSREERDFHSELRFHSEFEYDSPLAPALFRHIGERAHGHANLAKVVGNQEPIVFEDHPSQRT